MYSRNISNDTLLSLPLLRTLELSGRYTATDRFLPSLKFLQKLALVSIPYVSGHHLSLLSLLTWLDLSLNLKVENDNLRGCVSLRTLHLEKNNLITLEALTHLTNLRKLNLGPFSLPAFLSPFFFSLIPCHPDSHRNTFTHFFLRTCTKVLSYVSAELR